MCHKKVEASVRQGLPDHFPAGDFYPSEFGPSEHHKDQPGRRLSVTGSGVYRDVVLRPLIKGVAYRSPIQINRGEETAKGPFGGHSVSA